MPRYFALVPAAGTGTRMGEETAKQYLELAGRPLLHHTLRTLSAHPKIASVFVVLAPGDERFRVTDWADLPQAVEALYCGGETRAASVYNGLVAVRDCIAPDDWVLVHDAARPCLTLSTLDRLIDTIGEDAVGGLLAIPVADTLKRSGPDQRVAATESREGLWQAQTPQMFRYRLLVESLRRASDSGVTDEAGAIERIGLQPRLVMGDPRNIKVTYPEDLELAASVLLHGRTDGLRA